MSRVAPPSVPTPIRAITTPLRTRAAPPIPPAGELYEPLAKAVLRRRLTHRIFLPTALLALVHAAVWLAWLGRFGAARVLFVTLATWAAGVLPVVLLRKAYLTVTHTSAPSPPLLLQKSLAPPLRARTLRALQTHVLSALALLALHAAVDPSMPVFVKSRKHPYTPHPALLLLALSQCALAGLYVLRAVLRDVWVFPFRPPTRTPAPGTLLAPLLLPLLAVPVALALVLVGVPLLRRLPLTSALPLPRLRPFLRPPALLSLLNPFNLLNPFSLLNPFALLRPRAAWALGAQTAAAWEAAGGVWAWGVGGPLHTTPDVRALVSGVSVSISAPPPASSSASSASSSPFRVSVPPASKAGEGGASAAHAAEGGVSVYTHLAYAELLRLACAADSAPDDEQAEKTRKSARAALFDVDGAPWARLVREALVLLGREYRVLLGRGSPTPISASSSASTSPASAPAPHPTSTSAAHPTPAAFLGPSTPSAHAKPAAVPSTPLLKKDIFAHAPASPAARVGTALAAGGVVEGVVGAIPVPAFAIAVPAVDWTRLGRWVGVPQVPGWARFVGVGGGGGGAGAEGSGSGGARKDDGWAAALTRQRAGRAAAGWVPRKEVVAEVVGVLTHLTCASLAEDRFGVVQRDIPRVLEALLAFLGAVEAAQAGLRPPSSSSLPAGSSESTLAEGAMEGGDEIDGGDEEKEREREMEREREKARVEEEAELDEARAVLGEVGDALKDGIVRIVRTFGDKLRAFRFPPRTAARLQGFVDYCA